MSQVIADVSIRPSGAAAGIELVFDFPPTEQTVVLPLADREPLRAAQRKAEVYLAQLVQAAPYLDARTNVVQALHGLLYAGRQLTELLVQNDRNKWLELQDAFVHAWPLEEPTWKDDEPIPIVHVNSHDESFPLEMLPLFNYEDLPPIENEAALRKAVARFLGFTAIVQRVVPASSCGDHVLRNRPALPVQFIRHRKLRSVEIEERFLEGLEPHVIVEGPWPTSQERDAVKQALFAALYERQRLDSNRHDDPPVQIHHFACHCDTKADLDDDYKLIVTTKRKDECPITFRELRAFYDSRFFRPTDRKTNRMRSMVILNACASSRTDPRTAASFPRWFLSFGHRAFVGTEVYVPDAVAGTFAECLYGRLLQGHRLGEAIVSARRDLLQDFCNPLGLLYVMYGDTELEVEESKPDVHRALTAARGRGG